MDDGGWLANFAKTFGVPAAGWAAFCAMVVHWWKAKNERQRDLQTEKSGDWNRLRGEIDRLDGRVGDLQRRCDDLQQKLEEAEDRVLEWKSRAIEAEANLIGRGRANQVAANIVAVERLEARDKDNGGGK